MIKETTTQFNSLRDLYIAQLQDLYDAETQLVKALPQLAAAASSSDLKNGFTQHLKQTQVHAQRLEKILAGLGAKLKSKPCEAMKGLLKEGEEVIKLKGDADVRDAALIAASQRVEHYEMAGYGVVRTFAKHLGETEAKKLLQTTLDEEGETDRQLTSLAEGGLFQDGINAKAMNDEPVAGAGKKKASA